MPPRPKVLKPVVPLSIDVDPFGTLLKQSNHAIEIVDKYAQCRGCFARSRIKNAKEWIAAPCPKLFIPNPDFVHAVCATMPIGNRNIHLRIILLCLEASFSAKCVECEQCRKCTILLIPAYRQSIIVMGTNPSGAFSSIDSHLV